MLLLEKTSRFSKELVIPRPDKLSVITSIIVFGFGVLVSGDVNAALVAAIVVGILVFPFAFIARELMLLGRGDVDENAAGKVYEWIREIASMLNVKAVQLTYTYGDAGGLRIIGVGGPLAPALQSKIASMLHRAAWHGLPIAEYSSGQLLIVIPGLLMKRLSTLISSNGRRVFFVATSISHVRLAYNVVKAISYAITRSRMLAAYMASKLLSKLVINGYLILMLKPDDLTRVEREIPFENLLVKILVRKQLKREALLALA